MLGRILIGLAAIFAIVIALGFVLPDKTHVERSIVINAPQEEVFALVSDFNEWSAWSPWASYDPDMKMTVAGSGVGQTMNWESAKLGDGGQEITELDAPRHVAMKLDFGDMGRAYAAFNLAPDENGVRVTWALDSHSREGAALYFQPLFTYMGFFMDAMVGKDYETGLANLKRVAESR
ncbi:MAG: SRPBCC family protein [Parvularculaceae bacterium]|nr:SRPBCC family protein [Caulobacterales bacterium]